jgi:hypothetical protein
MSVVCLAFQLPNQLPILTKLDTRIMPLKCIPARTFLFPTISNKSMTNAQICEEGETLGTLVSALRR